MAAPTIASKPSTGLSAGLNSNLAFFSGDEKTTHISSVSGGLRFSQKKQVLSGIRFTMFTADDRWFIQGDNRLSWTSQNTYGLGADTVAAGTGTENVKFNAFKLYETAYRTVRPHLFAGVGINISTHSNIRPGDGVLSTFDQSAYAAYNDRHGFRDERPDLQRHQRGPAVRHARQRHQRAARLARQRGGPHLLQRLPRRRLHLAAADGRRAHLPQAHAGRPPASSPSGS